MKKALLPTAGLILLLTACADIDVPSHIGVNGETTVRVVHSIEVSMEMQNAFADDCRDELGPEATEEEVEVCRNKRVSEYVTSVLNVLQQLAATPTPTPTPQP